MALPCLWSLRSGCWGSWSAPSRGLGSWTGWGRSPGWEGPAGSCWQTEKPAESPRRADARWCLHTDSCCSGRRHWTPPGLEWNCSAFSARCCSGQSYWSWFSSYDSDSWWRVTEGCRMRNSVAEMYSWMAGRMYWKRWLRRRRKNKISLQKMKENGEWTSESMRVKRGKIAWPQWGVSGVSGPFKPPPGGAKGSCGVRYPVFQVFRIYTVGKRNFLFVNFPNWRKCLISNFTWCYFSTSSLPQQHFT